LLYFSPSPHNGIDYIKPKPPPECGGVAGPGKWAAVTPMIGADPGAPRGTAIGMAPPMGGRPMLTGGIKPTCMGMVG